MYYIKLKVETIICSYNESCSYLKMSATGSFPLDIWRCLFQAYPQLLGKAQCLSKSFQPLASSLIDTISTLPISINEVLSLAKEQESFSLMYWEGNALHVRNYTFNKQCLSSHKTCEATEYVVTLTDHMYLIKRLTLTPSVPVLLTAYVQTELDQIVDGIHKFDGLPTTFFSPEELTYEGIRTALCNIEQPIVAPSTANAIYSRRGSCIKILGKKYPKTMTDKNALEVAKMFPQELPPNWYPLLIPMMYQCLYALSLNNAYKTLALRPGWMTSVSYLKGTTGHRELDTIPAAQQADIKHVWERLQFYYEYPGRPN